MMKIWTLSPGTAWDKYCATTLQARFTAHGGEYRSVPDNHSRTCRLDFGLHGAYPGYILHIAYTFVWKLLHLKGGT